MKTWIKVCGITNIDDALGAASLGVDALGFIFAPSPRRIEPGVVREIIRALPAGLLKVGVFVNAEQEEVLRVAEYCGLNSAQFHGHESPEYCRRVSLPVIKAIPVRDVESLKEMERYPFATILLDTYDRERAGGTGKVFPWELALEVRRKSSFILSGGLNPWNVRQAIRMLRPMGVDVSSGVESAPGKKDLSKMINFVREVSHAEEAAG